MLLFVCGETNKEYVRWVLLREVAQAEGGHARIISRNWFVECQSFGDTFGSTMVVRGALHKYNNLNLLFETLLPGYAEAYCTR